MFDTLERIAEIKTAKGWSNYLLAKNSHIPQATVDAWFKGKDTPQVDLIEKVCDAAGITLAEFFTPPVKDSSSKLARMRKLKKLSQQELADRCDVSVETICAYEQKKRDISKAQYCIVRTIANVLECKTEDIVD